MAALRDYHGAIFSILGPEAGQAFASATVRDDMFRAASNAEAASLIAWAATGREDAGELPLLALEAAATTPGGEPIYRLFTGEGMKAWAGLFGDSFATYIMRALDSCPERSAVTEARTENVRIAWTENELAVTVCATAMGQTVAAHFGTLTGEPVGVIDLPPNAVRSIGRDVAFFGEVKPLTALVGEESPSHAVTIQ